MPSSVHERARLLIGQATVEGISPDEQRWLTGHIDACADCGQYAELARRTIRALDAFSFDMDPAAALRVQHAAVLHAERLASAELQRRGFSIGLAIAVCLTIAGSLAMWQAAAWLAARWVLSPWAWKAGFAVFWILPCVALDVLLLFRTQFIAGKGQTA